MTGSTLYTDNAIRIDKYTQSSSTTHENTGTKFVVDVGWENQIDAVDTSSDEEHNSKNMQHHNEHGLSSDYPYKEDYERNIHSSGAKSEKKPTYSEPANPGTKGPEPSKTDSGNERILDPLCQANDGDGCYLGSTDHRKVVSHLFGRNKRCTQKLADHLWIVWCRKHYQQRRYNLTQERTWHWVQLELVRIQLARFESSNRVECWEIALRKKERNSFKEESAMPTSEGVRPNFALWERFLVPYLGQKKTFADVRDVLRVIEIEFKTAAYIAREEKTFPGIEFLPSILMEMDSVAKPKARARVPHVKVKNVIPPEDRGTVALESDNMPSDLNHSVGLVPTSSKSARKRIPFSPRPLEAVTNEEPKKHRRLVHGFRSRAEPIRQNGHETLVCQPIYKTSYFTHALDVLPTPSLSPIKRKASSLEPLQHTITRESWKHSRLWSSAAKEETSVRIKQEETEE